MSHLRDRRAFGNIGTRKFRGARFGDALSPRGPQYTKEGRVLDYSTDVGPFTIVDQSGKGNTATLYSGRGLTMDAVNDTVTYATNYSATTRTASVWMRVDGLGARTLNGSSGSFTFTPTATNTWELLSSTSGVAGDLTWTAGSDCDIGDLTCATEHWTHNDWSNPTGDTSNGKPIVDSGPNDYHGTCTGCSGFTGEATIPQTADRNWNKYMFFDGVNDYVSTSLDIGALAVTYLEVEVKVFVSSVVSDQTVIGQMNGGNDRPFEIRINADGTVSFGIGGAANSYTTTTSSQSLLINNTYVLKGIYNGTTKAIYIDGVLANSEAQTSIVGSALSNTVRIGSRTNDSKWFSGIPTYAKITTEDGLIADWVNTGNTNADWVDNTDGYNGTVNGSPANMMVSASDANDQIDALGTAISEPRLNTQQLNPFGEGEYSSTADSASLDLSTAGSWELWGNFYDTVADTNTYISKYDDNTDNREWIVSKPSSVSAGEVRLLVDSDGASGGTETSIISGITTGIGHLVITKTGTVLKAYWNSVEITAPDFTGSSIYNGNAAVLIGAVLPSSPTGFCSNKIGSAKIYNTALTAAEVLTNYNTQKSLYGL